MSAFTDKVTSIKLIISNWRNTSLDTKVAGATIVVAVFTGMAKIVFFGKELVVAWKFGAMGALDAFLIAYIVPSFLINLIAGSMNAALIPTYVQVRGNEGRESAQKLYESAMTLSILFLIACTGIMVLSAPFYLRALASGFDADKLHLTLNLLYLMSPVIVLSGITTIRSATLNAVEKFAVPSFIPITTPILTIIFILAGSDYLNIYALALGLVLGQVIESYLLGYALRTQGIHTRLGWHGMDTQLRQVVKQLTPVVAGAFLIGNVPLVDQAFAATLPNGSISVLNYSSKVISFPMYIAATAIGTSVLPYFSSTFAQNDGKAARQMLNRYLKLIFALTVPIAILLMIFSKPLVGLLLQRGSFTEADTMLVAKVITLGSLQMPFYIAGILVVRLISAMKANRILMWSAFLNLTVNIITDYIFMKLYGVVGISLSTSVVYFIAFLFLLFNAYFLLKEPQSTPVNFK